MENALKDIIKHTIVDAELHLVRCVERGSFTEANTAKGYLNGLRDYSEHMDWKDGGDSLLRYKTVAEEGLKRAIKFTDYGRAAFWHSYLSAWEVAETMHAKSQEEAQDE